MKKTKTDLQEEILELAWRAPRVLYEKENMSLPIPRLQISYRSLNETDGERRRSGNDIVAEYGMVYEHLMGDVIYIALGKTYIGGCSLEKQGFQLPFRDGAHIRNEMFVLKLRGFVINQGKSEEIFLSKEDIPGGLSAKMKGTEHKLRFKDYYDDLEKED